MSKEMPNTFKEWFKEKLSDSFLDITMNGADAGFSGIIYTSECVELFDTYDSEIWDLAIEQAEEMGYKNVIEFISTFNRKDMFDDINQFKNLMIWFACETLSYQYDDSDSDEDDEEELEDE